MNEKKKAKLNILKKEMKQLRATLKQQKLEKAKRTSLSTLTKTRVPPETNFLKRKELTGHFGKIYAMHWASDSRHLVSASQDGKLLIWDGYSTHKRHIINLRSSWVMTCAYSPSMRYVACGGLNNLCSIYRVDLVKPDEPANAKPTQDLASHEGYLSCCRFLDDNKVITSSGDSTCLLWDISRSLPLKQFLDHKTDVMSIATQTKDPNIFVSGSCDFTAKVWDIRSGSKCVQDFVGHQSDINSVQWFPDNTCFGSGSDDSSLRLWDTRAYAELNCFQNTTEDVGGAPKITKIGGGATSIDFSTSGKYTFCGYDDKPFASVWDTLTARNVQDLKESKVLVSCLGVPQNGYCLGTGSWDNNLTIWA